ncbi:MAG: hypothetical protein VB997_08880, partial [Opitutales bacterium]
MLDRVTSLSKITGTTGSHEIIGISLTTEVPWNDVVGIGPGCKNHAMSLQVLAPFAKPMPVEFLNKGFHEDLRNQPYATIAAPKAITLKDLVLVLRGIPIGIPQLH